MTEEPAPDPYDKIREIMLRTPDFEEEDLKARSRIVDAIATAHMKAVIFKLKNEAETDYTEAIARLAEHDEELDRPLLFSEEEMDVLNLYIKQIDDALFGKGTE